MKYRPRVAIYVLVAKGTNIVVEVDEITLSPEIEEQRQQDHIQQFGPCCFANHRAGNPSQELTRCVASQAVCPPESI